MKITRRAFLSGALKSASAFFLLKMGFGVWPSSVNASVPVKGASSTSLPPLPHPEVVVVRSPGVADWNFKTYPYIDSIDDGKVKAMLDAALMKLTGAKNITGAWRIIFKTYRPGDKIAIKPNFNDLHSGLKGRGMVTSPAVLNAVIEGLTFSLGAEAADITIYDLTSLIPDEMRARIRHPVNFVEPYGSSFIRKLEYRAFGFPLAKADPGAPIKMKKKVTDASGNPLKCYIPVILTSTQHIINMPLLKAHRFISNSGALKNHYGTVRFSDGGLRPKPLHPPIIDDSVVDINAHSEIRDKTRLVVMDGLFGRIDKDGPPVRWKTFGNASPEMFLLSQDPVAIDSVARHYLEREMAACAKTILSDNFLKIASTRGLGVYENPGIDGVFTKIDKKELFL